MVDASSQLATTRVRGHEDPDCCLEHCLHCQIFVDSVCGRVLRLIKLLHHNATYCMVPLTSLPVQE